MLYIPNNPRNLGICRSNPSANFVEKLSKNKTSTPTIRPTLYPFYYHCHIQTFSDNLHLFLASAEIIFCLTFNFITI